MAKKKKHLVIVESPAKAKTINKYLGRKYLVKACMGHVRDLPKGKIGIDLEKGFEPKYQTIRGKGKIIAELKKDVKKSDMIYLAPDPDREGEAIAWHLSIALNIEPERLKRVTFNEITPNAVKEAFNNPGEISQNLVNAQQARRILDRIVGYKLSPLLWAKIAKGLSAGRVQSVAVRLIVEREKEIKAFKPEEYWKISVELSLPDSNETFNAELIKYNNEKINITSQQEAEKLVEIFKQNGFVVDAVQSKEKKEPPPPPFITSTIQQQASTILGFTTKKTMVIAQQLYEGVDVGEKGTFGLITYMRTDSVKISSLALGEARSFIPKVFGNEFLNPNTRVFKSKKSAQQAHECIRPTKVDVTPDSIKSYLTKDQFKLYNLIWKRFVATQMAPAVFNVTTINVTSEKGLFQAKGKVPKFLGWQKLYSLAKKETEQELPAVKAAQKLHYAEDGIHPSQHFTQPPPRYTEASLIKALEKFGIGRPSTYAPIISTIQSRGYVNRQKKTLFGTELGILVIDKLVEYFENILNTDFTSQMEEKLDLVEEGKQDWVEILKDFYSVFEADFKEAEKQMTSEKQNTPEGVPPCEKCGSPMVLKWHKNGNFLGCSKYPECKNLRPLSPREETDIKCEKCGANMIIVRTRKSPFLGCKNYPDCKNTQPMSLIKNKDGEYVKIEEKCDKCGKTMVIRRGRRGAFLACPGYPECKNTKSIPRNK